MQAERRLQTRDKPANEWGSPRSSQICPAFLQLCLGLLVVGIGRLLEKEARKPEHSFGSCNQKKLDMAIVPKVMNPAESVSRSRCWLQHVFVINLS